ncbi:MAG: hypothetical protein WD231_00875 [Candidatus Woykebacteria bacterium]
MEIGLAFEYFLLTLAATFASLQMVAILKNKREIAVFKNRNLAAVLYSALIALSFYGFFSIRDRNVQTFLEGAQLSAIFGIGAFSSLLVTKILKKLWI